MNAAVIHEFGAPLVIRLEQANGAIAEVERAAMDARLVFDLR